MNRDLIIKDKELKPVYFIYGAEDYLTEEAVGELKGRGITESFESLNYQVFDAKTMDAGEVLTAAGTMPAFSERRVVVVKGADGLKAAQVKSFVEYVKNPSPTTCLVFVADTGKVNKNTEFYKILNKSGAVVQLARLKDHELLRWIKKEAERQGKKITDPASRKLLVIAGTRLREIKNELDKIVLYAGDKEVVAESDVDGAGLDCREETIFGLSDAIGVKDLKRAMKIYGKVANEPPLKVLGAMARQIRTLLKLKSLQRRRVPKNGLAPKLGVPPWHLDSYISRSRHFTEGELRGAVVKLAGADMALKTGRLPQNLVITGLIMDLCVSR